MNKSSIKANIMETTHNIIIGSSANLPTIKSKSISLIITSPPYPMIDIWDECFINQDKSIDLSRPGHAFNKMHKILDGVWEECDRVLMEGGFICINIGDATRKINNNFQLYSNHSRIIEFFAKHGYSILPDIHWRKPSNAPNKFMGSGMYPAGAYVTYEHEYILIFRKGRKREFTLGEKELRRKSAYFWEERNEWFSDLWVVNGTKQKLNRNVVRDRSGAFPFEIPYRLVNMYSIKGDTVLDPFGGMGTTSLACIASERNSVCCEFYSEFKYDIITRLVKSKNDVNTYIKKRLQKHTDFIKELPSEIIDRCYRNESLAVLVKTKQETELELSFIESIKQAGDSIIVLSKYDPRFID